MADDVSPPSTPLPIVSPFHYRMLGWVCLGGMFLACFERGQVFRGALLTLVGMVALFFSLRSGPALLMFAFGASILAEAWALGGMAFLHPPAFEHADLLLPACMLGFVVAQARVAALSQRLFPEDPRPVPFAAGSSAPHDAAECMPTLPAKRGEGTLRPDEIVWFVGSVVLAAVAAQCAWIALGQRWRFSGFSARFLRLLVFAWILGGTMTLIGILARLYRRRRMSPDQGQMVLQEELWNETRRDQARVTRWRFWARNRRGGLR